MGDVTIGALATIADLDHRHVADEVDRAHFHLDNLQSKTLLKVGDEVGLTVGLDKVHPVVLDDLRGQHLQSPLQEPYSHEEDEVGDDQFDHGHTF